MMGSTAWSCLLRLPPAPVFMVSFASKRFFPESPVYASVREKLQGERPTSMAISQDLLEILACPACRAKVELKPDRSGLKCVECHRLYPIRDDIPVMLIDEATIEVEGDREARQPERT